MSSPPSLLQKTMTTKMSGGVMEDSRFCLRRHQEGRRRRRLRRCSNAFMREGDDEALEPAGSGSSLECKQTTVAQSVLSRPRPGWTAESEWTVSDVGLLERTEIRFRSTRCARMQQARACPHAQR